LDKFKSRVIKREKLQFDLRKLELFYMDQKKKIRDHKTYITIKCDPNAIIALRKDGKCDFRIPELILKWIIPAIIFEPYNQFLSVYPALRVHTQPSAVN
jgi:hypothetical protein